MRLCWLSRQQLDTGRVLFNIISDISVDARLVNKRLVHELALRGDCTFLFMFYRNKCLKAVGMTILQPFKNKLLSEISSSLIFQYLCAFLGVCLHVEGHQ